MVFKEQKDKFIETWGKLGTHWGINRTMAQIHALLLISKSCMSAEEIMQELSISRGNANVNLRALQDWGLVHKKLTCGDRKEYFQAEKDMHLVLKNILQERKKKELEPLIKMLSCMERLEDTSPEAEEFKKVVHNINEFALRADKLLCQLCKADSNWFVNTLVKLM